MNHFINTAATDLSRARTTGLNQLTPEPFPVLVVGTRQAAKLFFADRGTLEDWSGDATYGVRLTIGDAQAGPIASTFELTVAGEDPVTIPFDVDQAGLKNILNDIETVGVTDGGVEVLSQGLGRFVIAYNSVGIPAAITTNGALLIPDCSADLVTLTAGDPATRQLLSLTLSRTTPAQITAWTPITSPYAGWSGVINLNGSAAVELLRINGVKRGAYVECTSLVTIEVLDQDGNPSAYFQAPVILRALNYMDISTLPVGPSRASTTIASPSSVAIAPTSQIHTQKVTISGIAGVYNLLVSGSNLTPGARIDIICVFTGAAGADVRVYANSTGGTLLFEFINTTGESNATFSLYADGSGGFDNKDAIIPAFA